MWIHISVYDPKVKEIDIKKLPVYHSSEDQSNWIQKRTMSIEIERKKKSKEDNSNNLVYMYVIRWQFWEKEEGPYA